MMPHLKLSVFLNPKTCKKRAAKIDKKSVVITTALLLGVQSELIPWLSFVVHTLNLQNSCQFCHISFHNSYQVNLAAMV